MAFSQETIAALGREYDTARKALTDAKQTLRLLQINPSLKDKVAEEIQRAKEITETTIKNITDVPAQIIMPVDEFDGLKIRCSSMKENLRSWLAELDK